jgi:hypothetical protein
MGLTCLFPLHAQTTACPSQQVAPSCHCLVTLVTLYPRLFLCILSSRFLAFLGAGTLKLMSARISWERRPGADTNLS